LKHGILGMGLANLPSILWRHPSSRLFLGAWLANVRLPYWHRWADQSAINHASSSSIVPTQLLRLPIPYDPSRVHVSIGAVPNRLRD
jgi:hypothetical protein